ncbi:MAG: ribbon-helix-helix domain-containing protein [Candidatus Nanopelagicales bacterium]
MSLHWFAELLAGGYVGVGVDCVRHRRLSDAGSCSAPRRRCSPQIISYYTCSGEKIQGRPVTEQDIQDWAEEAERGYAVEQLRKRGRRPIGDGPAQVVPVRIDGTLMAALTERADRDQVSRSEAIRAAIRSYVA